MSQVCPLDSLIRRLDPASLPDRPEPDERLVVFDARKGQTLSKKPIVTIGRDIRYYLVSTRARKVEVSGPICKLKSRTTGLTLEITVAYEARCEPGNEERLVQALWRKEHPAAALDDLLTRWVEELSLAPEHAAQDLCIDFSVFELELRALLTRRAAQEAGLVLEPTLRPLLEDKLETLRLHTDFFPIRVRDFDEEANIKLTTDVAVDPENRIRALLSYRQLHQIETTVKEVVCRTLADEITLHQLCYETKTRARELLVAAINQRLHAEGRKITFLQLDSPLFEQLPPKLRELSYTATCNSRDHQGIRVEHQLQILLQDLGSFRTSRVGDLERWTEQRLQLFTQELLFDRSYVHLLLDFGCDEKEIKSRMQEELAAIGCAVKQLIVIPDLEPLTWRHGIQLDKNENSYLTHDSRVEVRLNVVVKGKIVKLEDERLASYLRPESRLLEDIREVIDKETQHIMHGIDPERFYMRFQYTSQDGEQPVRTVIEDRVKAALVERFVIEDISVIAKPLETDLTKRLSKLLEGPHSLEVSCFPLNDPSQGEQVIYRIDFNVEGVHEHGWYTFCAKSFPSFDEELARIREVMAQDIRSKIELAPREYRQFNDLGVLRQIEKVIHESAQRKVVEAFGLCVSVVTVTRKATAGEEEANAAMNHARETALGAGRLLLESKAEELDELTTKKRDLLKAGVDNDDPELQAVQERIRVLEAEVTPDQLDRGRREVGTLLPGASGKPGTDWAQLALEPPLHRKKLTAAPAEKEAS
ncbi:MAG TPA: hypothetical protein VKM72_04820 [Thermoanaerobaculia bacterium]|nr:hypothetical protein [Thermoanaerobaculia bacterium]